MIKNAEILQEFFRLENSRKWAVYQTLLHPDVEWILLTASGEQRICGIETYMEKIISAYENSSNTFSVENMIENMKGDHIATVLINNHGNRSIDIFEFENGLIKKEYEYILDN